VLEISKDSVCVTYPSNGNIFLYFLTFPEESIVIDPTILSFLPLNGLSETVVQLVTEYVTEHDDTWINKEGPLTPFLSLREEILKERRQGKSFIWE
jgi:hypothetical protein